MMTDNKAPAIQKILDATAELQWGRTRTASLDSKTCVCCGKSATSFTDDLSKREYSISGLCQTCQDTTFGVDDDD